MENSNQITKYCVKARIEDLKNIKSDIEGYIWMSDARMPICVSDDIKNKINNITADTNPFIIEGQLKVGKTSYSIKWVDGGYVIRCFDLDLINTFPEFQRIKKVYKSNLKNNKLLEFIEIWEAEVDRECCNMPVLKFKSVVFNGFLEQHHK